MLKHQGYIKIGRDIGDEYAQCRDEGRDVGKYKGLVDSICALDSDTIYENEALIEELSKKLAASPMLPDYQYEEPSSFDEIMASSPAHKNKPMLPCLPSDEALLSKIKGAWLGRIAGCLLGKPVEGWRRDLMYPVLKATDNYPLKRYIRQCEFSDELVEKYKLNRSACFADNVKYASPADDDTNYTTFGMKLIERYGREFKPDDVMEGWMSCIPICATFTAERAAYRNAAMGLLPPETATHKNPYREWIGAQIRGDFFGYINPGDPEEAASMAFRDASISHVKNGIYGEMFVSAMIAAAAVLDDMHEIIETGLAYIPEKSRLTAEIRYIMKLYDSGMSAEDIIAAIHSKYDEYTGYGWCGTIPNAMIVTMALLCGGGDYGASICLAVQACFDTDCNGATVGSILGMMLGEEGIDPYWYAPFEKRLYTSIEGYSLVEVDDMANKTLAISKK